MTDPSVSRAIKAVSAQPVPDDFDPPLEACPLCGNSHIHAYHEDDKGRRIQRCAGCGVQFMNPQYTNAYLQTYYSSYIRVEPETDEPNRFLHHYNFDLIQEHKAKPGRLLDIGCGRGHLLRVARERGWHPVGHDVDPDTVASVSREFDLEIHAGEFLDLPLEEASFDLVTMHHVLEHLKDPVSVVGKIRKILRPGGLLFVALPNIEGLSSGVKFSLEKMGLRRKGVGSYYDADHHLVYYSPTTLAGFLSAQGFDVEYLQSAPRARPGDSAWVRTLRRHTTDKLLQRSAFLAIATKAT